MADELENIQRLQAEFDRARRGAVPFYEEISGENIQALEHLVVCIAGEVGELANVVKKVRRGDSTLEESRAAIVEETADIFIYTLKLANQLGFQLHDAFSEKMRRNESRFGKYER
jgi:NTP pyrophosphatase (non-canonical NTP hydrolase)